MLLEDLGDEVGIKQEIIWGIKILKYLFKESNHLLKTGFVYKLSSELKGNLLRYDLTAGISFLGNDQSTGTTLSTEYLGSHIQPLGWEATFIPLWLFVSLCFFLCREIESTHQIIKYWFVRSLNSTQDHHCSLSYILSSISITFPLPNFLISWLSTIFTSIKY